MRSLFELALLAAILAQSVVANDEEVDAEADVVDAEDQEPEEVVVVSRYEAMIQASLAIGYEVEGFSVTTDDGWVLPLYHILKNTKPNFEEGVLSEDEDSEAVENAFEGTGTVLALHGNNQSAMSFAQGGFMMNEAGFPFQLFDLGFDVWMGTMRASGITECATDVDCGFDDIINFYDMGTEDLPALIDGVLAETTDITQLDLVALERGTAQTLVGMAKMQELITDKVNHAVLLNPCLYTEPDLSLNAHNLWTAWRESQGINNTRPEQYEEHQKLFCDAAKTDLDDELVEQLEYWCKNLANYTGENPLFRSRETKNYGSQDYYNQIGFTDKLQEPVSNADFAAGEVDGAELSLGDITGTMVSLFVGSDDDYLCTVGSAKRMYDELGTENKTIRVVEYKDSEDKEAGKMTYYDWSLPLSDSVLRLVSDSLQDQANFLSVIGAVSAASMAALALF